MVNDEVNNKAINIEIKVAQYSASVSCIHFSIRRM